MKTVLLSILLFTWGIVDARFVHKEGTRRKDMINALVADSAECQWFVVNKVNSKFFKEHFANWISGLNVLKDTFGYSLMIPFKWTGWRLCSQQHFTRSNHHRVAWRQWTRARTYKGSEGSEGAAAILEGRHRGCLRKCETNNSSSIEILNIQKSIVNMVWLKFEFGFPQ